MLTKKIKDVVRSHPILHRTLRPFVRAVRGLAPDRHRDAIGRFRKACTALSSMKPYPMFVKVGANDGVTGDPCSDILLGSAQWRGVLIEPVPYCFERLKANFPDSARFSLEPVAIGKAGTASFYYVDPEAAAAIPSAPYYYDQLGSFRRDHIVKHLGPAFEDFIRVRQLEVQPLCDVLDKHAIGDFQLLHIDVEGYDYEVLKTLDFERHKPTLIFIEHKHLGASDKAEMAAMLRGRGYTIEDCGADFFAMHEKQYKVDRRQGEHRPPC